MGSEHNRQGGHRSSGGPSMDRGRGFKRVSSTHVEVYDLDMAAYVHMHNVPIAEATRVGNATLFVFLDPEEDNRVDKLVTQWLNSESARYANHVRNLKKVAFSSYRNQPRR